jgi:heavy metal sensor kinase
MATRHPVVKRRSGLRRRWHYLPVRWRLTTSYAAFLAAAFLAFGLAMYIGLRFSFYNALDEQVEDQAALILLTIQEQGGNLVLYPRDIGDLENDEHFVRLLSPDGAVITDTSVSFGGVDPDSSLVTSALNGETQLTSVEADGETFRTVTAPVIARGEVSGVLQVGMAREEVDEALRALVIGMLISGPVVLLVAAIGGYTLAGRVIAPVREIARQAASINSNDLRSRLNLDLPNDELGQLAATFDRMLDRIEDAFERQTRFTGDAAHELRTPLSLIRSQIDLALLGDLTTNEHREALLRLQGDVDRITELVSTLLAIARSDAGQLEVAMAPIDLAETIDVVREQFAPQAETAGVQLLLDTVPCHLMADEDLVTQVLVNLVSNALAHTGAGDTVTLGCRSRDAGATFWVADTGAGIAPEHQAHVFDRFYRVSHSGPAGARGSGLGLSICRMIVQALGGRIRLESEPGVGTTVRVDLPSGCHPMPTPLAA